MPTVQTRNPPWVGATAVRAVRAVAPKPAIAKGKGRAAPAPAQVAPDVRARLPFQALCLKLAGQMPVMLIRSLVSKGVIPPEMGFGPAAPAPMSLEELRQKTQETVTGALQQIQGWRDRAELMQCLNSVIPLERFSEAWRPIRDAALETCEAMACPLADGHALVLLEFLGGGYGALVAAAWAMRKDDWDAYKAAVMAKPVEPISNETLGGRTSDECFDSHFLMNSILESADPGRVNGFLAAFPDRGFGTAEFFSVLDCLAR